VRYGGLKSGTVQGTVSVRELPGRAEDAGLGLSEDTRDLRERVSNTRKAKNMIGKVSNYFARKGGDQGPFARPYGASGEDMDVGPFPESRQDSRTASTGVPPSLASAGSGRRSTPNTSTGRYSASHSSRGSLVDVSDLSDSLPPGRGSSRRTSEGTDPHLLEAFGYVANSLSTKT